VQQLPGGARDAIDRVADHGISRLRELHADLVRAAGVEHDAQQAALAALLEHAPLEPRPPRRLQPRREAPGVARIPPVRRIARALVRRHTCDEREILLLDQPLVEGALQRRAPGVREGERKTAAGVAIETVHDARKRAPALRAQLAGRERYDALLRVGFHRQAGRFVHDGERRITK
jgi:hypothetical protein